MSVPIHKYIVIALILSVKVGMAQPAILLKDDFNSNVNGWWTGSAETYSMKLEGGKYVIHTKQKDNGRFVTINPYMDTKKDFSIEATFVQKSGSDNNGLGLLWGDGGTGKYHEFVIACNGNYKIKSPEKGDKLNQWLVYEKIKPIGEPNMLKIEQKKGRWYYFINGMEVANTIILPLYGMKMGFINYTDMVLEIDNFIFRQDIKINLPANLTSGLVKENLGKEVNSPYDDLGPHITTDGRMILFGRELSPENIGGKEDGEDIWITTSTDGVNWSKSKNMGPVINDKQANNLAAISADNNMLLFCRLDGFQVRKKSEDGWTNPEYLNVRFKNESKNMEGNLTPDGKALLFTAKLKQNVQYNSHPENKEKDVYVTVQDGKGLWSEPINLGAQINTAYDEISPFMAADGRTLYFASNGRPGYGGYDIYMSKRTGDSWTEWSEPVNLGPEINTTGFDAYYTLSAAADYAYMVSDRNSFGASDLVRIKLPDAIKPDPVVLLIGLTLNAKTKAPVKADIFFEDLSTQKEIGEAISDPKTGSYRIALTKGKNYGIRAQAKGYLSVNENLELASIVQYKELQKDLFLIPIEAGESIALNNVFFEQSRAVLKSQSFPELDRLVAIMNENPSIQIELSGHTDNIGNKNALLKLSEDRVEAVKTYLVEKGINKSRILGKGYGGLKPIAPNDTNENRQRNRRVEVMITKK
ncbi:MAG: OmpA family protein [Cyclobacteriaceae bacterium]|nr:OmpA family protein [Cyclobacteriaceae bacterium]